MCRGTHLTEQLSFLEIEEEQQPQTIEEIVWGAILRGNYSAMVVCSTWSTVSHEAQVQYISDWLKDTDVEKKHHSILQNIYDEGDAYEGICKDPAWLQAAIYDTIVVQDLAALVLAGGVPAEVKKKLKRITAFFRLFCDIIWRRHNKALMLKYSCMAWKCVGQYMGSKTCEEVNFPLFKNAIHCFIASKHFYVEDLCNWSPTKVCIPCNKFFNASFLS